MYELNLPKYGIKIANENGHLTIFGVLRRKYVALTPVLTIAAILDLHDDRGLQSDYRMPAPGRHHTAEISYTWVKHISC